VPQTGSELTVLTTPPGPRGLPAVSRPEAGVVMRGDLQDTQPASRASSPPSVRFARFGRLRERSADVRGVAAEANAYCSARGDRPRDGVDHSGARAPLRRGHEQERVRSVPAQARGVGTERERNMEAENDGSGTTAPAER